MPAASFPAPAEGGPDDPREVPKYPVAFDLRGPVRVTTAEAGVFSCFAPCMIHVPGGWNSVSTPTTSGAVKVEGPTRVAVNEGVPAMRTLGVGMMVGGGVVILAALAIPLLVCQGQTRTMDTQTGVVQYRTNPCADVSDGVKVGFIAAIGISLVSILGGAIVYAGGKRHLVYDPVAPLATGPSAKALTRPRVSPWLRPESGASLGARASGGAGGLTLSTAF